MLIKPGHTFDLMFNRPRGHFQPREFHHRSQKIKSSFDSPDKRLVGMLLNVLLGERFIDDPDRRTQFPAARSENLGSTTNRVPVGKIQFSVFSFQFSVFSFQFSGCRVQGAGCGVQNLEISSYSCDSFYSWFPIFAFFDKDVIHESNAVFHGLA